MLAVVDASTLGEFRMHAIPWQMSTGCQAAGFLGVLSSELSVYTLTVITLERNYAITHAMHLNKRLSLRHAVYLMTGGWVFALTMAILPLTGVSDYRKFAVCLPFETDGHGLAYVVFLMLINGVAFLILMGCYLKIYCAIRGSQAWNSNDSRIAKRMALLVFSDFICWAPIAFFSLTAAFGLQLISLEEAKIFTVFILPLNSCCNPFLYALLTKQFKKDCVQLCKTIEESRVTRGIGRCRHSSNFSNRQTPANTNSALDPTTNGRSEKCQCQGKSKEHYHHPPRFSERLRISALKYFFCHKKMTKKRDNDYSYNQNKGNGKGKRKGSLSSETYSSSWSDTWRQSHPVMPLRLLERRRQNSFLSRKPSQESNLSSSRNDSSATTASTSTWRISRSSVSSDISSSGPRGLSKNDSHASFKLNSLRKGNDNQNSVHGNHQSTVLVMHNSSPNSRISNLMRNKPKLLRQSAVEKETYLPNKNGINDNASCPLHQRSENLSCVYEQESYEEEEQSVPDTCHAFLTPTYKLAGLTVGFLPRKLSTISSVSITKDGEKESPHSLDEGNISCKGSPSSEDKSKKEQFYSGKCVSLTLLPQSPNQHQTQRCPSDSHLSRPRYSVDIRRPASSSNISVLTSHASPIILALTENHLNPSIRKTTAVMVCHTDEESEGDDEDGEDDVFLDDSKGKPLETHFPLEEPPHESHPLI